MHAVIRRLVATLLCVSVLSSGSMARAQAPRSEATPRRIAIVPLQSLAGGDRRALGPLEGLLVRAVASVPGASVIPPDEILASLKRARRPELRQCEGDASCLAALGKLVGATQVVSGEAGELSEGHVVYLGAVDVAAGKQTGLVTASFGAAATPAARETEARAAAFRLLSPERYAGHLALTVDTTDASVWIDGKPAGRAPLPPIVLPVGTHALRITHEAYRDFVRFVNVGFEQSVALRVDLRAYPVIRDDMHRQARPAPGAEKPWYRTGWAAAGLGAFAFSVAMLVAIQFDHEPDVDDSKTVDVD